ncbi:MAG: ATP-binding cassette domain-containing protein [Halanaerobiaceae bacterium]
MNKNMDLLLNDNVISVENLTKEYGNQLAVDNISFTVKKGEVFGFLGPNGAGKSTTINILLGLLKADSGECSILGRDIANLDEDSYSKIGVVFEEKNLYTGLTGFENLKFFADLYGIERDRIKYLLGKFDLSDAAKKRVKNYSKGMRQRLLLCRALLHEPELLILDEPTGGLDPVSLGVIHQSILDFKKAGKTILLSTHYMEEADLLCDRLAFISKGSIIAVDTPDNLKKQFGEEVLEIKVQLIEDSNKLKKVQGILSEDDSMVRKDNIHSILLSMDFVDVGSKLDKIRKITDIINIHSREATLHDVFIKLTTDY